ncbi:MAG TPA: hypothetical protein VF735_08855 [Pyrinomonadaceae bacterium]
MNDFRQRKIGGSLPAWGEWQRFPVPAHEGVDPMLNCVYECFRNRFFIVFIGRIPCEWGDVDLMMIWREDKRPIQSWDDLQRIKNGLRGYERTAIEVFPSESRLINEANLRHLWVLPESFKLPFGLHLLQVFPYTD